MLNQSDEPKGRDDSNIDDSSVYDEPGHLQSKRPISSRRLPPGVRDAAAHAIEVAAHVDPAKALETYNSAKERYNTFKDHRALKEAERAADQPDNTAAEEEETGAANKTGNRTHKSIPYKVEGTLRKTGSSLKRASALTMAVSGLVVGFLIAGIIAIVMIMQGPLQLIHLSEVLNKAARGSATNLSLRQGSFLGSLRALGRHDIAETRVTVFGSRRFHKLEAQLKDIGIEFDRQNSTTGLPRSMDIDPEKNPSFRDSDPNKARAKIAKFYGIPSDMVQDAPGGRFTIPMDGLKTRVVRSLRFTSVKALQNGVITSALNRRVLSKFFNVPSAFRPWQRVKAEVENRYYTKADRRASESERMKGKKATMKPRYHAAKAKVNNAVQPYKVATSGVLFITGIACIVHDIADAVVEVNYMDVEVPSMMAATDKQAAGSQLMYGKDFHLIQAGATAESLVDEEGKTVWGSKALDALASNSAGEGKDIDIQFKQAFSHENNAANIANTFSSNLFTEAACSPGGKLVQILASVGLLWTGPGGWTAKAGQVGTSLAAAGAVILISNEVTDFLSSDPVNAFAGPEGGSLLAYGSRASENASMIPLGSIALSGSDEQELIAEFEKQDREEFQERSFFARMFDIYDHRSVASSAIRSSSPSLMGNISNIASAILNPIKLFSNSLASLTPKALANEGAYDWGFPLYGIPRHILEDPTYSDPYENARKAEIIFKDTEKQHYITRAKACFGVDIKEVNNIWDVVKPGDPINPAEAQYPTEECGNLSEPDWIVTMLFVFDTGLSMLIDCYEGDSAACQDAGVGGGSSSGGSSGENNPGGAIIGDPNTPSADIDCAPGTKDLGTDTPAYSGGVMIPARLCEIEEWTDAGGSSGLVPGAGSGIVINSRVSGAWLALYNAAQADGVSLSATSSFRTFERQTELCGANGRHGCARPGYSNHQSGHAIDFRSVYNHVGGSVGSSGSCQTASGNQEWEWLVENASRFGFGQLPIEAWHWDADHDGGCN